jgi:glycosyltransferase involved in cell wall biosynthesis
MPNKLSTSKNHVAVLLGYYKGEKYIREQLDSILKQDTDLKIWISNDGDESHTRFLEQENSLQQWMQKIELINGPKSGFAKNFSSLIANANIKADFYAWADQDDVWEEDKLSRALQWLKTIPEDCPACYCSRTQLIDEAGNKIGYSPLFKKKPSFQNALVQSIAGGNTMVMNQAARDLLAQTKDAPIVSHDWWAYMLITGAGGQVYYDPHPSILYRQHRNNLVGSNDSLAAKLERIIMMLNKRFRDWNHINCEALQQYRHLLATENQETYDSFCKARQSGLLKRIYFMWKSGVYRQTKMGNIGLAVATVLNKV